MQDALRKFTRSCFFQRFIILVIVLAGILVGLETNAGLMEQHGSLFHFLDKVILAVFVVEIILKMGACGSRPFDYFKDPWNLFDFFIVAVCLLPIHAQFAAVLRLARILRVLRLITALPRLQLLVGALLKSIPSMGYVGLMLGLLFYIYAVMGTSLFGHQDAQRFGTLGHSMLSLFTIITLEGWADLMYGLLEKSPSGLPVVLFFISFILFGTMIMLNLFIGVIINSMSEAQAEEEERDRKSHIEKYGRVTASDELQQVVSELEKLKDRAALLARRIEADEKSRNDS